MFLSLREQSSPVYEELVFFMEENTAAGKRET